MKSFRRWKMYVLPRDHHRECMGLSRRAICFLSFFCFGCLQLPKPVFMHCRTSKRSVDVEERLIKAGKGSLPFLLPSPPPLTRLVLLLICVVAKSDEKGVTVKPVVTCLPHMPTSTCTYIVVCPNTNHAVLIDTGTRAGL